LPAPRSHSAQPKRKTGSARGGGEFSLEDLIAQMRQMRKMGTMGALMESLPQAAVSAAKPPPAEELDRQLRRS
jgi:signal recognition particle subunit SRP54